MSGETCQKTQKSLVQVDGDENFSKVKLLGQMEIERKKRHIPARAIIVECRREMEVFRKSGQDSRVSPWNKEGFDITNELKTLLETSKNTSPTITGQSSVCPSWILINTRLTQSMRSAAKNSPEKSLFQALSSAFSADWSSLHLPC